MNRKIKFNVIDVLIVLVLLGCMIGIFLRYDLKSKLGLDSRKTEVEISFLIIGIRQGSTEALVEGDTIYWKQNGMEIGQLMSKEVSNSETWVLDENYNKYIKNFDDLSYDVRGVIKAKGNIKESGFMLNGTQYLAPGKTFEVESKNISVALTITNIRQIVQ